MKRAFYLKQGRKIGLPNKRQPDQFYLLRKLCEVLDGTDHLAGVGVFIVIP